jgi:hypothetical protein
MSEAGSIHRWFSGAYLVRSSGHILLSSSYFRLKQESTTFRKLDLSVFMWGEGDTYSVGSLVQWLRLAKRYDIIGVSFHPHEDWNRSSFRNDVFPTYLEYRAMKIVQKPNDWMFSNSFALQYYYVLPVKMTYLCLAHHALTSCFLCIHFLCILDIAGE